MMRRRYSLWVLASVWGCLLSAGALCGEVTPSEAPIQKALQVLSHTPTGKSLIARAQQFWGLKRAQDLTQHLRWGKASKTDAVLTRHFDPKTGQEIRDREVTIYLRQGLSLEDLVLDIAHELVHATSSPAWDPYDPSLTAGKYIWAAIEGEGGEVQAVIAECRVGFDLFDRFGAASDTSKRCQGYLSKKEASEGPALDTERVRKDFYRVGKWNEELATKLGSELKKFPLLAAEAPRLYSSTGNAPYPVALLREFEQITQIACENTRRRVAAGPARTPAAVAQTQDSAARFIAERCAH